MMMMMMNLALNPFQESSRKAKVVIFIRILFIKILELINYGDIFLCSINWKKWRNGAYKEAGEHDLGN